MTRTVWPSIVRGGSRWMLVMVLGGCGYSEAAMRAQRDQNRALQQQLESRDRSYAELRSRNEALAESVRALGGNVDALTGERAELRATVTTLEQDRETLRASLTDARRALDELRGREEQARARAAQFRQLLQQFRSMIDAGELTVRVVRNRMVISLPEGVLFDTGRADVKPRGRAVLASIAQVLRTIPRDFQVAGHTDNVPIHTPRFPSNWELSTARATEVTHLLITDGLAAERVSAAGFADTQPVGSNADAAGRQQNRRIEIVLLPNLSELPDVSAVTNEPSGS